MTKKRKPSIRGLARAKPRAKHLKVVVNPPRAELAKEVSKPVVSLPAPKPRGWLSTFIAWIRG